MAKATGEQEDTTVYTWSKDPRITDDLLAVTMNVEDSVRRHARSLRERSESERTVADFASRPADFITIVRKNRVTRG